MLNQATAVRTTKDIPAEELLGYLTFINIEDVRIHKDDLGQLFDDNKITRTFLPHEIKAHDAFRRATSKASATIEIDNNGAKQTARLLVREVKTDNKQVIRHLVREIVDSKNEVLDYATVGKMVFDRQNQLMNVSWDSEYLSEYAYNNHLNDINALFIDWTQFHTRDTVRSIVTKIVGSMNPVSVQRGGRATFIPKYSKELLLNLKEMVSKLPGNTSSIEILPLIDAEDVREMVARRAEEAMAADVQDVLDSFTGLLSTNQQITPDQMKRYTAKFIQVQDRVKQYQGLLNRNLTVINKQVQEALTRVGEVPVKEETNV